MKIEFVVKKVTGGWHLTQEDSEAQSITTFTSRLKCLRSIILRRLPRYHPPNQFKITIEWDENYREETYFQRVIRELDEV